MNQPDSNPASLNLISHHLCPFVQRSVIVLLEKGIPHLRHDIDLANKPDWFLRLSPLGKVPVLLVDEYEALFESAVICEYLNDITPGNLHSDDPLIRAQHRAWIELGSALLMDIAGLYSAADKTVFMSKLEAITTKWQRLEHHIQGPYFSGTQFGMVDAAFGPIFRYFDVIDSYLPLDVFEGCPQVQQWRASLAARSSVKRAASEDYPERLRRFLHNRNSYLSGLMELEAGAVS